MTGEELRLFREKRSWSQQGLARALGVSRHTVWHWENAKRRVPYSIGYAIAYIAENNLYHREPSKMVIDGKHLPNTYCERCRWRHPPQLSCKEARTYAEKSRSPPDPAVLGLPVECDIHRGEGVVAFRISNTNQLVLYCEICGEVVGRFNITGRKK